MAKKTNKTSHVMDLLTHGASPEVEAPPSGSAAPAGGNTAPVGADGAGQEKTGDAQSHAAAAPKVTVVDEGSLNDRLSQEILNNLSKELKEDTQSAGTQAAAAAGGAEPGIADTAGTTGAIGGTTAGATDSFDRTAENSTGDIGAAGTAALQADAVSGQAAGSAPAAAPGTASTAAAPADAQRGADADEPAVTGQMDGMSPPVSPVGQTHHAIIPKSQISSDLQTGEYRFVNVMEQLMLRQDVASFQEQYDVCRCKKCTADICALALTGLPSKYVVTRKDALSPILSYYESKYRIFMLTELIKACNKVKGRPRHKA